MKLQFLKLDIKNFKSFRHEVLDLRQFGTGLHFMCGQNLVDRELGSNGAGKSTIWDALFWCLYGKTPRNLRNPAIRPWVERGVTKVSLRVKIDKKVYTIIRTASPNRLMLKSKGNPKKDSSQEQIEQIIGLSPEIFGHAILMGQFSNLFFDLRPAEKMTLFSEILNLDQWLKASDVASERCETFRTDLEQISSDISFLDGGLMALRGRYREIREAEGSWTLERKQRLSELEQSEQDCTKNVHNLEIKYERLQKRLQSRRSKLAVLLNKLNEFGGILNDLNWSLELNKRDQDELVQLISKSQKQLLTKKSICPLCKQPWTSKKAVAHRKELQADVVEGKNKQRDCISSQRKLVLQIKEIKKKVASYDMKSQQETRGAKVLQDKESVLHGEFLIAETKLKNDRETLDELRGGKNPYKEQLSDIRIKIKTKKEKLEELKKKERLKIRKLERTQFWVKAFKEVRLYLMEQTLKHLEIVTNSILPELGLEDWNIYYDVERETKSGGISRGFNVVIVSPSLKKGPVPWESWSGGEGQRLRLAGAFALSEILLNQAGVNPDLEILDEPAHRLSPEGLRDLCAMLQDRARRLDRATWYIDHQTVEQVGFDSVVTVEKDGTGSHVQY